MTGTMELRRRMETGGIALGCNVRFSRSPEVGALLAASGMQWIMLDFEHSPASPHLASDIALGALRAGVVPLARPSSHDPREIAGLLTNGALGLIVPHVDTPAQAVAVAAAARFAPRGVLSVPGSLPHFGYALSLAEACARFNEEVMVLAMIESAEALANAPAIAAVPGIDGLFIGASDLLWETGHPGDYGGPVLRDAMHRVARAARDAGKFSGMGGPREEVVWQEAIAAGIRFVMTENDLALLMRGARDRAAFFERCTLAASPR
ncbi:MAG: aldolase/citrate lyase family protein [Alphaproteobacteria bacterium]|nr:aldolase/citrate lyase family protein [Alphaproteobacteria bacterium]